MNYGMIEAYRKGRNKTPCAIENSIALPKDLLKGIKSYKMSIKSKTGLEILVGGYAALTKGGVRWEFT